MSPHLCVCSVHFVGGVRDHRMEDVPQIFDGHQVLTKPRWTRSSLSMHTVRKGNLEPAAYTDEPCAGSAEDVSVNVDPETVLRDLFYSKKNCEMLQHSPSEVDFKLNPLAGFSSLFFVTR